MSKNKFGKWKWGQRVTEWEPADPDAEPLAGVGGHASDFVNQSGEEEDHTNAFNNALNKAQQSTDTPAPKQQHKQQQPAPRKGWLR